MIYLVHPRTEETRICETEESARQAEARGFERVSYREWKAFQRLQDDAGRERNREADEQEEWRRRKAQG